MGIPPSDEKFSACGGGVPKAGSMNTPDAGTELAPAALGWPQEVLLLVANVAIVPSPNCRYFNSPGAGPEAFSILTKNLVSGAGLLSRLYEPSLMSDTASIGSSPRL